MGTKFAALVLWYHLAFILYALLNMIMSSALCSALGAVQKIKVFPAHTSKELLRW